MIALIASRIGVGLIAATRRAEHAGPDRSAIGSAARAAAKAVADMPSSLAARMTWPTKIFGRVRPPP